MDDVTRLLCDLVAIPSVNPMGRPLTGAGFLEREVSDYLEHWFHRLGVPCVRQRVADGRDNLIARYDAPGARRVILFDVHQDTVPTDGMTIEPFHPVIKDGRLFGRGSCDVKGSMAAMLMAFQRLVKERPAGSASVILACTVDEEFTHKGSSALPEAAGVAAVDLAIVAEPTRLNLVRSHKGAVRWKIHAHGVACHSSSPLLGVNAIYRMASVIAGLQEFAQSLSQGRSDPLLGPGSLSVGRIEGGQSVNIVPDWCTIEVDRRLIPGESPGDIPAQTRAWLEKRLGQVDWLTLDPPWVNMPALDGQANEAWIPLLGDIIAEHTGSPPTVGGVPYGTDAGPLNAKGIPCVVFGPGDIAQAHTKDEWIELDQVRQAVDLYHALAVGLG